MRPRQPSDDERACCGPRIKQMSAREHGRFSAYHSNRQPASRAQAAL
jgi:hypothetical protein